MTPRRLTVPQRDRRNAILAMRRDGLSLQQIGLELDPPVTKEAVRLILKKLAKEGLTFPKRGRSFLGREGRGQ